MRQKIVEIREGEETRRLAVCNLDWERVRVRGGGVGGGGLNLEAIDVLAALRSFAPTQGEVLSVTVYPSEFGKTRMKLVDWREEGGLI
jgi:hypothetical protein